MSMTKRDFLLDHADREVRSTKKQLVDKMRDLADDLTRAADRLERNGTFNSLGEVQGSGREVDRLCAVLREKENAFKTVKNALEWLDDQEEA